MFEKEKTLLNMKNTYLLESEFSVVSSEILKKMLYVNAKIKPKVID